VGEKKNINIIIHYNTIEKLPKEVYDVNISTMTFVITSIVSYEIMGLSKLFVRACWGHAMFKCY
jgi:hypothetical protein